MVARMDKQVKNWVRDHEVCLLSGKSVRPRVAPLQPVQWPAGPWDRIQIDIFGELHAAPYSQRFMIVVHDLFSKWPEVQVVQNVTIATVIDFLQSLFVRWGLPRVIVTDNGPQFTSFQFEEYLQKKAIQHVRTSCYHPEANGGIKRFNQVLKQGLKTHLANDIHYQRGTIDLGKLWNDTPCFD